MTTYGYIRVSTAEQAEDEKTSLTMQENRVKGAALSRGDTKPVIFRDIGVSGSVPLVLRRGGGSLVSTLKSGDILVAAKLDRLFRSASDALTMAEKFKEQGVSLVLCDIGPDSIMENGISKLFFGILASFAEFEKARIAERMQDGRRGKQMRGGAISGVAPFGYSVVGRGKESVIKPNPEEMRTVRYVWKLWKSKIALRKISEICADQQMFSRVGTPLCVEQIRRIIKRGEPPVGDGSPAFGFTKVGE